MCPSSTAVSAAWAAAGFEVFSGVNVPSKAFGEYIEHASGTPNISAAELERLLREKADMVVLDSRPFDEYSRVSIPTGINVPGAELVLRAREIAPSPDTMVVVNCAGRTRSIIGAQSLINAGAAEQGRGAAQRHHGLEPRRLCLRQRQEPPRAGCFAADARLGAAGGATRRQSHGVARIDRQHAGCLAEGRRRERFMCSMCAIRAEYAAGHVAGAISAPGGQLVQATDQYVGTLGARIVLIDDAEVRAAMTGIVAAPNGLEGRIRSGRSRHGNRPAAMRRCSTGETQAGERHRRRRAQRASLARRGNGRRSFARAGIIWRATFPAPGLRSAPGLIAR